MRFKVDKCSMNKISVGLLLLLLVNPYSYAIEWEVIGQDSPRPVFFGSHTADLSKTLGDTTVKLFDEQKVPYIGNESGMNSILNTPVGDKLVVINNETLRAYGWCFSVDGMIPDFMPDKFYFTKQTSKLSWFFAYSLYEKGEWTKYCVPAHTLPLKLD